MDLKRENEGYCFIGGKTKPSEILGSLQNIPYDLLPPTLKKVEDFLTELNIEPIHSFPPKLARIGEDLNKGMESMESMSKNAGVDFMVGGVVPYIHSYSKCDYGQKPIEMVKKIEVRKLYDGIENALYTFHYLLRRLNPFLNEKGKELIDEKHITYSRHDSSRIEKKDSDLTKLGSELIDKHYKDFDTPEIKRISEEIENTWEMRKSFDFDSDEYKELYEKSGNLIDKRTSLRKESKINFKRKVREYWEDWWYDRYAWDFDEEERKELKNPYLIKEKDT